LGIRIIAGKTSDRYGRIPVMKIATLLMALSMITIAFSMDKTFLIVGGILFGCAVGMNSPTVSAWTIDLSLEKFRGRALATMYISLEAGIGCGALLSGWLYNNQPENFKSVFLLGAFTSLTAFLYLFFIKPLKK
jgi:MFS family permease